MTRQLMEGSGAIAEAMIAAGCRFTDCRHEKEPGCAVRLALEQGTLASARLAGYQKLRSEQISFARRRDVRAVAEERRRVKSLTRELRDFHKQDE